jgi:hypothetical protein
MPQAMPANKEIQVTLAIDEFRRLCDQIWKPFVET